MVMLLRGQTLREAAFHRLSMSIPSQNLTHHAADAPFACSGQRSRESGSRLISPTLTQLHTMAIWHGISFREEHGRKNHRHLCPLRETSAEQDLH